MRPKQVYKSDPFKSISNSFQDVSLTGVEVTLYDPTKSKLLSNKYNLERNFIAVFFPTLVSLKLNLYDTRRSDKYFSREYVEKEPSYKRDLLYDKIEQLFDEWGLWAESFIGPDGNSYQVQKASEFWYFWNSTLDISSSNSLWIEWKPYFYGSSVISLQPKSEDYQNQLQDNNSETNGLNILTTLVLDFKNINNLNLPIAEADFSNMYNQNLWDYNFKN